MRRHVGADAERANALPPGFVDEHLAQVISLLALIVLAALLISLLGLFDVLQELLIVLQVLLLLHFLLDVFLFHLELQEVLVHQPLDLQPCVLVGAGIGVEQ